jgi:hypothetical protein
MWNVGILSILWKVDGRWMEDDGRMVEFLGMTNAERRLILFGFRFR